MKFKGITARISLTPHPRLVGGSVGILTGLRHRAALGYAMYLCGVLGRCGPYEKETKACIIVFGLCHAKVCLP